MECHCHLQNILDLLSRNAIQQTSCPVWSMVECHPISAKDLSRLHQFSPKVLPGFFLGCALHAMRIWKGDFLVADTEEWEQMDASET